VGGGNDPAGRLWAMCQQAERAAREAELRAARLKMEVRLIRERLADRDAREQNPA